MSEDEDDGSSDEDPFGDMEGSGSEYEKEEVEVEADKQWWYETAEERCSCKCRDASVWAEFDVMKGWLLNLCVAHAGKGMGVLSTDHCVSHHLVYIVS